MANPSKTLHFYGARVIIGGMKRPQSHVIGDLAETQVTEALQTVGCSVGKITPDYGEDLFVEIPTNGELTGIRILLQVKGTRRAAATHNGRVTLGRIATSLLSKWACTLNPCVFIRWNVNLSAGHYAFTNTANNFLCSFSGGQKSKTLSAPETNVVSCSSANTFVSDAVLAHRLQEELIHAIEDPSEGPVQLDESDVQRVVDILVSIGLIEDCGRADGDVWYLLSQSANEEYAKNLETLSVAHPNGYAEDLIRSAWVFTIRRRLGVRPAMEPRLVLSCLRILKTLASIRESVSMMHEEFGHPLQPGC